MGNCDLDILTIDINISKKKLNSKTKKSFSKKDSNNFWFFFNLIMMLGNAVVLAIYLYIAQRDKVVTDIEEQFIYLIGTVLVINIIFFILSVISMGSTPKYKRNRNHIFTKNTNSFQIDKSLIA